MVIFFSVYHNRKIIEKGEKKKKLKEKGKMKENRIWKRKRGGLNSEENERKEKRGRRPASRGKGSLRPRLKEIGGRM